MKKKINPAISEHYRNLGKKSAAARAKKIIEKAQKAQKANEINASKPSEVIHR